MPLLEFVVAQITQPAFTCRLRWEPKTYVCWDNRIYLHQAFNDYDDFRRELYRTMIDDPPVRFNSLCPPIQHLAAVGELVG